MQTPEPDDYLGRMIALNEHQEVVIDWLATSPNAHPDEVKDMWEMLHCLQAEYDRLNELLRRETFGEPMRSIKR